jgi:hypothetical protein
MAGGLLDAYLYGGNKEALKHLDRITGLDVLCPLAGRAAVAPNKK